MSTEYIARRRDLTLENTSKKTILLIDMAYPNEYNKVAKQDEKIENSINYALNYENNESYAVKVISTIIG